MFKEHEFDDSNATEKNEGFWLPLRYFLDLTVNSPMSWSLLVSSEKTAKPEYLIMLSFSSRKIILFAFTRND